MRVLLVPSKINSKMVGYTQPVRSEPLALGCITLHAVSPTRLPSEEFHSDVARLHSCTTLRWRDLLQRVKSGRILQSSLRWVCDPLRDVTSAQAYLRSAQRPDPA